MWTFHILSSIFTIPNSCYKMETQHLLTNANQNSVNKLTNPQTDGKHRIWRCGTLRVPHLKSWFELEIVVTSKLLYQIAYWNSSTYVWGPKKEETNRVRILIGKSHHTIVVTSKLLNQKALKLLNICLRSKREETNKVRGG